MVTLSYKCLSNLFRPLVQQLLVGHVIETSRSHSDKPQAVGLLWTSDSPTYRLLPDNTQRSQQTDIHATAGIEPAIPGIARPQADALDCSATWIRVGLT